MAEYIDIYTFETEASKYPCTLEVTGMPDGMYLSSTEPFEKGAEPTIRVNANCDSGEYYIEAVLIDANGFRSDVEINLNSATGEVAGQQIGPFHVYSSSFDAIKDLTDDLYVSFQGVELCGGGCNAENKYMVLDDDDYDYIN